MVELDVMDLHKDLGKVHRRGHETAIELLASELPNRSSVSNYARNLHDTASSTTSSTSQTQEVLTANPYCPFYHAARGSSPKRFGAKSRVREIRPSPALSKFLHLPHGRRTDNSHIFVAHHDRHHASNACFCQQHWLQMSKYLPKAFVSASNILFLMC